MAKANTLRMAGFLAALFMSGSVAPPASAQVDIAVKGVCPGVWVTMPSASYEIVKVCKRDAVTATAHHAAARKHQPKVAAKAPMHVAPTVPLLVALVSHDDSRECVSLSCPRFLLTGVGY